MLTISPDLARAFEAETLARWNAEIAARIARDFPQGHPNLTGWVTRATDAIRRAGATSRADMELYAHALYAATEASADPQDAADLIALMTQPGDYMLRIKTLRKAFPL